MTSILDMSRLILRRQLWAPFLIVSGAFLLFSSAFREPAQSSFINTARVTLAAVLVLAGIAMMAYQLRLDDKAASITATPVSGDSASQPEYTVFQLSKNYELLRRQTTQGFILSGIFMALGLLVILSGSAGTFFGFTKEGSNLTTVAGVIMEFISGTSLLVYRLNFQRLNETTDKLDSAWRVLTAHKLAQSLPEGTTRTEATMKLVEALLKPAGQNSPTQATLTRHEGK